MVTKMHPSRSRPKAVFSSELPLRVEPADLDKKELRAVVAMLPDENCSRSGVQRALRRTAREYQHSRKLQAQRPGRPSERQALLVLADDLRGLAECLLALEVKTAERFHRLLSARLSQSVEAGHEALMHLEETLSDLAEDAENTI